MNEDELNIDQTNVTNYFVFVFRVTILLSLIFLFISNTSFLESFLNISTFFWIYINYKSNINIKSRNFFKYKISSKCSLLPVLINELANFKSVAKVKQKLNAVICSFIYKLRDITYCKFSKIVFKSFVYFRVFANLSRSSTVIIK